MLSATGEWARCRGNTVRERLTASASRGRHFLSWLLENKWVHRQGREGGVFQEEGISMRLI